MSILTNPLFLSRVAGLIAFALAAYFPNTSEEKLASGVLLLLSWLSGLFERSPIKAQQDPPKGASGPSAPHR